MCVGEVTEAPFAGVDTHTEPALESFAGGADGADGGNGAVPVIGPCASATVTVGQALEGFDVGDVGLDVGADVGALGLMLVWPPHEAANIEMMNAITREATILQPEVNAPRRRILEQSTKHNSCGWLLVEDARSARAVGRNNMNFASKSLSR